MKSFRDQPEYYPLINLNTRIPIDNGQQFFKNELYLINYKINSVSVNKFFIFNKSNSKILLLTNQSVCKVPFFSQQNENCYIILENGKAKTAQKAIISIPKLYKQASDFGNKLQNDVYFPQIESFMDNSCDIITLDKIRELETSVNYCNFIIEQCTENEQPLAKA